MNVVKSIVELLDTPASLVYRTVRCINRRNRNGLMTSSGALGCWLTFLILPTFLLCGCRDDSRVVQHLGNTHVETGTTGPEHWFYGDGDGKYDVTWTDEESVSREKSLRISTDVAQSNDFAYWGQFIDSDIPHWHGVTLKACIKGNLSGQGVSLVIRGDGAIEVPGAEQYAGTQDTFPITGNFDWSEFSITLDWVDPKTQSLTIYLVYLPKTTGEVYFDDIRLFHLK